MKNLAMKLEGNFGKFSFTFAALDQLVDGNLGVSVLDVPLVSTEHHSVTAEITGNLGHVLLTLEYI